VDPLPLLSVVVPVFREALGLDRNVRRLSAVLDAHRADFRYEIILVNDGSPDDSLQSMETLRQERPGVIGVVSFVRNFGQVAAILAGMARAQGDCMVVISADLQDPPELIPVMFDKWRTGSKTVLAVREARLDNWTARVTSAVFYSAMQRYAIGNLPRGGFDFYLLDRTVAARLLAKPESNCFLQGHILYASGPVAQIPYTRRDRSVGVSGWPFGKKLKYFIDGFTGYTFAPIRLMSIAGILCFGAAMVLSGALATRWMFFGARPHGWTWVLIAVLSLQAVQMMMMGVLGEYIWRTLDHVRGRAPYIVDFEALPDPANAGGACLARLTRLTKVSSRTV
jgi:glycosyltransferase involved in cell wall biosynthesis